MDQPAADVDDAPDPMSAVPAGSSAPPRRIVGSAARDPNATNAATGVEVAAVVTLGGTPGPHVGT